MQVFECALTGYRSLRRIRFPLSRLNVFVGDNGVGKTNLYRALQLLQAAAAGTLGREIATEGGMESAAWAGERRKHEKPGIELEVAIGERGEYRYAASIGFAPRETFAGFGLEPIIKEESLVFTGGPRPETLLDRTNHRAWARDEAGTKHDVADDLLPSETALAAVRDAGRFPDADLVRRTLLQWRFYHTFRTDAGSPHIREDTVDLDATIADAFPGARLVVPQPDRTTSFGMIYEDFPKRVFEASELSDGTLRFLALAGALLGYRLPPFLALNEPETSLHPDHLPALARLIARAAQRSQVWIVTHSQDLATALEDAAGAQPLTVIKRKGETWIEGLTIAGELR
jgi:predicted ATPase